MNEQDQNTQTNLTQKLQTLLKVCRAPIMDYLAETFGGFGAVFATKNHLYVFDINLNLTAIYNSGSFYNLDREERINQYAAVVFDDNSSNLIKNNTPYIVFELQELNRPTFNKAKFQFLVSNSPLMILNTPTTTFNLMPNIIVAGKNYNVAYSKNEKVEFKYRKDSIAFLLKDKMSLKLPVCFKPAANKYNYLNVIEVLFIEGNTSQEVRLYGDERSAFGLLVLHAGAAVNYFEFFSPFDFLDLNLEQLDGNKINEKLDLIAFSI